MLILLGAAAAHAQLYRWTDEQGKVHVTDTPPPKGAKDVRKQDVPAPKAEPAEPYSLGVARKNYPVTLYTTTDCKPCDGARDLLNARGVPFDEKSVTTQELVDEVVKIAGKSGLPVMIVGSSHQQGFSDESYNKLLDAAGYPKAGVAPPRAQGAPEAPKTEVKPAADAEPRGPYAAKPPAVPDSGPPAVYKPSAPKQRETQKK
jgi:glutaredoxin